MFGVEEDDLAALVPPCSGHLSGHTEGVGELSLAGAELTKGLSDCHRFDATPKKLAENHNENNKSERHNL